MREENIGHRFVAPGREPGRAEVAAADVHRDGKIRGLFVENLIDASHVQAPDAVHVDAAVGIGLTLFSRAKFPPARVVKLQIPAAALVESEHRVGPGLRNVVKQALFVVPVDIDRLIVGRTHAADQVQHRGRRNRVLHGRCAGDFLQAVKGIEKRMVFRKTDAAVNHHGLSLRLLSFKMHGPGLGLDVLDAGQSRNEVKVPEGAAELAVGDGHKTVLLFFSHKIGDFTVFHGREFITGDDAGRKISAGSFDGVGSQEAADHVGTVRRINAAHVTGSHFCVYRASGTKKAGQDG